ncbi:putative bifunctional diguanylate cyclase/phosphodiesterase [Amphibiibacter pelophylacis]|uniref:EAL domain-containing protein n=1 Tax=Amphibiibacter pelophylacis TaxID=1799477 RepID=A0ACC6P2D2_9BURK
MPIHTVHPLTASPRDSAADFSRPSTLGEVLQARAETVERRAPLRRCTRLYVVGGVLFGLAFVLCGFVVDALWRGWSLSPQHVKDLLHTNPLHAIIATAPLVLGAVFGLLGLRQDRLRRELALRMSAQELARFEASHDSLTGCANRRQFQDNLIEGLQGAGETRLLALVLIDIDHFKHVNDTYGHYAGDELIRLVSRRLSTLARGGDTLARFGADELGLLWLDMPDEEAVQQRLEELDRLFDTPFLLETYSLRVTVSAGAALAPLHGQDPVSMLKAADIALFRAKADGRGCHCLFSDEMGVALRRRRRIELGLDQAVRSPDQLTVFYQPLVGPDGHTIRTAEALVRWTLRDGTSVGPGEFIPIAEETGLIWPLGEWVMRRVFAQANRWPQVVIAINLSPVQLRRSSLISLIEALVLEYDVQPARIEFEVTEGVLLENHAVIQDNLDALRAMGFRIALDDFGTGYSSLSYLRKFAFHKVKIDQSFVRGIGVSSESEEIVRAIVSIGRALGLRLVAEGVETREQFEFLRGIQCDEFQGYLFAHPMPHHAFWEHLHGPLDSGRPAPPLWPQDESLPARDSLSPSEA